MWYHDKECSDRCRDNNTRLGAWDRAKRGDPCELCNCSHGNLPTCCGLNICYGCLAVERKRLKEDPTIKTISFSTVIQIYPGDEGLPVARYS